MRPDADALRDAVDTAVDQLAVVPDDGWQQRAAGLEWSCRETVAHVLDDLAFYALLLSGRRRGEGYTPIMEFESAPGRPAATLWPEASEGTAGVLRCLDAVGGLLAAVVSVAPPGRVGWHPYGDPDASGVAAMGLTELMLHTDDILRAHQRRHRPDAQHAAAALDRIFPHAERGDDPWQDLLAATGRTDATRGREWRWDSSVRTR